MITKTRSATNGYRKAWSVVVQSTGGLTPVYEVYPQGSAGGNPIPALEETIQYTVGHFHNYCKHTRKKLTLHFGEVEGRMGYNTNPPVADRRGVGRDAVYGTYFGSGGTWLTGGGILHAPGPVSTGLSASLQSLYSGYALRAMWPGVSSGLSVPNALYELKELKAVPRQVLTILNAIRPRNVRTTLGKAVKRFLDRRKVIGNDTPVYGAGSAVLLSEFGVKPLVRDCMAFHRSLTTVKTEAERLRRNLQRPLTSHWRYWVTPATSTYSSVLTTAWPDGGQNQQRFFETVTDSWYTATMEYMYDLPPGQLKRLEMLVTLDALGMKMSPKILWDAIPWSFAVDWFVKVGDFLDRYTISNVTPIVHVRGFVHSYKWRRELRHTFKVDGQLHATNKEYDLATQEDYFYERRPYLPSFYGSVQTSGLNTRKLVLAGALAATRRRRPW